ncbi:beclin-1-like protein [Canna indica]|uniref:Beclin-1-like protein n=1 Tax=Canna indica TaxID=4628 RepID=A0AAQ3JLX3_9LILI|nr:beclin-1-like protein [Canna indica]
MTLQSEIKLIQNPTRPSFVLTCQNTTISFMNHDIFKRRPVTFNEKGGIRINELSGRRIGGILNFLIIKKSSPLICILTIDSGSVIKRVLLYKTTKTTNTCLIEALITDALYPNPISSPHHRLPPLPSTSPCSSPRIRTASCSAAPALVPESPRKKNLNRAAMKNGMGGDKGRSFPLDPNLPRWVCQNCRHALCVVGVESYADKFFNDPSRSGMQASTVQGSVMGSSRMDHSFVVLSKQKYQGHGVPPRPRNATPQTDSSQSAKAMEESYVVLPPPAASMYKSESMPEGGGAELRAQGGSSSSGLQVNSPGFHSSIVLKRAFDIATSQTQVEQPLCLECMRMLSDKLDKEVEDVNGDIKAYEACLQRAELESYDILSEAEFQQEKEKIEDEERRLQAAIEEIEKQYSEVDAEMKELETKSKLFKELEERYWHEFNTFQFQLISHQEERDALLAKIEVSQSHLEVLKRTNVLNDAFSISHDGDFGTINNFRLGRLPKIPVEWDEINAAWGQACLLLHTMAQHFRPKFPYRIKILPMGSYPRIMDYNNNTYELTFFTRFGPVNLFWSTRYDKAMTLFLTCLKEFSEFANLKDQENNIPPDKCFKLPYRIENDKVESYTITQSFNKHENWTKALKYTLCNLKWVQYWFVGNSNFQPLAASSHIEVPPVLGSSFTKQSADKRS